MKIHARKLKRLTLAHAPCLCARPFGLAVGLVGAVAAGTVVEVAVETDPEEHPVGTAVEVVAAETGPAGIAAEGLLAEELLAEEHLVGTAAGDLLVGIVAEEHLAGIAVGARLVGTVLAVPPAVGTAAGAHLAGTDPGQVVAGGPEADRAAGTGWG